MEEIIQGTVPDGQQASVDARCRLRPHHAGPNEALDTAPALLDIARPLHESARGNSSAGRALRSQCRGQGFDPPLLH